MVKDYLQDLNDAIHPEVEDCLFAEWEDFVDGRFKGDVFSPRRTRSAKAMLQWPKVSVNAALEDFEQMALQQFGMCMGDLERGTGGLLCVRANYGTSIIPSLFGARLFMMDEALDTLPTSYPLGEDAIRELVGRGVPDMRGGLGGKVLAMGARFAAMGDQYPNIGRHVHVYHPDLQGPLDVCEVLWGSAIMTALYEQPDLVKALLELVTETYLAFMQAWEAIVPPADGPAVHWKLLHKGRIMLRDDSAMNLSPELVEEFVLPYDQRLLSALGGGAVHSCGRVDHYIDRMSEMDGLYAFNMSQPEYNDMETVYRATVDKGIHLVGLRRETAESAVRAGRHLRGCVHAN